LRTAHVALALALGVVAGCDAGDTDTDVDTDVADDGCGDLHRSLTAGMTFFRLTVDGVDQFVGFDAASGTTPPPACVNDDGTQASMTFVEESTVYGTLSWSAATASQVAFPSSSAPTLVLFGYETITFGPATWNTGGFDVSSVGSPTSVTLDGRADGGGHTVIASISADVTP
jgi:hypothetical protein